MGVMGCFRNGCDHVMCNHYSEEYGYICLDCYRELVVTGPTTDIKVFMKTPKKDDDSEEAEARYSVVFRPTIE